MSLILVNPDWKPTAVKAAKWYLGIGAGFAALRVVDLLIRRSKMASPAPLSASSIAAIPLPILTWPLNAFNIAKNIGQRGLLAVPVIGALREPLTQPTQAPTPLKGIGGNYY